jgi:hypothetical protein
MRCFALRGVLPYVVCCAVRAVCCAVCVVCRAVRGAVPSIISILSSYSPTQEARPRHCPALVHVPYSSPPRRPSPF